jgi:hypothetical protein
MIKQIRSDRHIAEMARYPDARIEVRQQEGYWTVRIVFLIGIVKHRVDMTFHSSFREAIHEMDAILASRKPA